MRHFLLLFYYDAKMMSIMSQRVDTMKDNICRYTLRIPPLLLEKFGYIAEYEGRTKNREIEQMIRRRIADFERENGPIPVSTKKDKQ